MNESGGEKKEEKITKRAWQKRQRGEGSCCYIPLYVSCPHLVVYNNCNNHNQPAAWMTPDLIVVSCSQKLKCAARTPTTMFWTSSSDSEMEQLCIVKVVRERVLCVSVWIQMSEECVDINRSFVLLAGVRWGPTPKRLFVDFAHPKLIVQI